CLHRTDGEHPDVVHDQVDAPELLERGVAHRAEVVDVGHVAAHSDGRRAELVGDCRRPILVAIGDDDLRASSSEGVRRCLTDPASRTRENGNTSAEIKGHGSRSGIAQTNSVWRKTVALACSSAAW